MRNFLTLKLALFASLAVTVLSAAPPPHAGAVGAVYTMTNDPVDNAIVMFDRRANGALSHAGAISTGGQGTGAGLGNQAGLALSADERWLLAVNAGSSDVSLFAVTRDGLELVDVEPSGGLTPISVTVHRNLVYVLNEGGSGSIAGFRITRSGLEPVAGSIQPLSGPGVDPAQIGFDPSGDVLVVTEKNTDQILTYTVERDGRANPPTVHPSAGPTPFGFEFGKRGELFVSEAAGGAPLASSASSYLIGSDGSLELVSPVVASDGTAACWLVVTQDGRFAYTSNFASDDLSTYAIGFGGEITLKGTTSTGPGSGPLDSALTNNSRFLYVFNAGTGTLGGFRIEAHGELVPLHLDISGLARERPAR
ncbi:MAG: beta-propeller fold lactonase family protein [Bryobacterales bacterium]